jgi:hypothetical protein
MSPRVASSLLRFALLVLLVGSAASCGGDDAPPIDIDLGVLPDASPQDAGDGGALDAGPGDGGDVDECALGTDDCDRDPAALCANMVDGYTCVCPAGFTSPAGDARGVDGCLLSDPSLSSLVPSAGALSPAFAGGTTTYTLALPPGTTSVTLTPSVAYPTRATITVDGVIVASGAASARISIGFAPRPIAVTVTTDSGATRTYTIVVGRGSAYAKASNTGATDYFGFAVALSSDGSTLAIGAYQEASSATGVGGDQTNDAMTDAGAVYVFTRAGSAWSQQAYVKASNTGESNAFGYAVALSSDGSTLAVGAPGEASGATGVNGDQTSHSEYDAGAVYIFVRGGSTWSQQAYIKASNTASWAGFGIAVSLSADGSTLAVGASTEGSWSTGIDGDQANNIASRTGAVYVFTRAGTDWSQAAFVKASNTGAQDRFGSTVALSPDGSTLAVGATYEASNATGVGGEQTNDAAPYAGAVYVFTRAGGVWSQQAYIKASNTSTRDMFGCAVALSSDGSTLAVGAGFEASNAVGVGGDQANDDAPSAGAVYVFTRAGGVWSQEAYLKASNTGAGDMFGAAVALSSDGSTLAIGAAFEASTATGIGGEQVSDAAPSAGAVYLFTRAGSTWSQEAYLKASTTDVDDRFGTAVALSADGSALAVGAYIEDSSATGIGGDQADNSATDSGAVYVY